MCLSAPSEETLERGPRGGTGNLCTYNNTDRHIFTQNIHRFMHTYGGEIHHEESQVFCIVYQIFMKVFFLSFLDEVFFNILDIDIVLLADGHLE